VIKESGRESGEGVFHIVKYAIHDWEKPLLQELIISDGTKVPCGKDQLNLLQFVREYEVPIVKSKDGDSDKDKDEEKPKTTDSKAKEVVTRSCHHFLR